MADVNLDDIKALYVQERGYWRPWNDVLLQQRPAFLQAYARYAGYPASKGVLSERIVELVYVALDSSATHLFPTGLKLHMQKALAAGASAADIIDVLTQVCLQGATAAVDAMAEVADVYGAVPDTDTPDRADLAAALPLPASLLARLAPLDPPYLGRVLHWAQPTDRIEGGMPQRPCLINIALHACFTGVQRSALRASVAQAHALGVANDAVVQVIQMGAHLAVHGTALGATTLAELAGA